MDCCCRISNSSTAQLDAAMMVFLDREPPINWRRNLCLEVWVCQVYGVWRWNVKWNNLLHIDLWVNFFAFFGMKYSLTNPVRTDLPLSVVLNVGIFSNRKLFDYQRVKLILIYGPHHHSNSQMKIEAASQNSQDFCSEIPPGFFFWMVLLLSLEAEVSNTPDEGLFMVPSCTRWCSISLGHVRISPDLNANHERQEFDVGSNEAIDASCSMSLDLHLSLGRKPTPPTLAWWILYAIFAKNWMWLLRPKIDSTRKLLGFRPWQFWAMASHG